MLTVVEIITNISSHRSLSEHSFNGENERCVKLNYLLAIVNE